MTKINKSMVTEAFKHCCKYGFTVKTFNSNRYLNKGQSGFIDHLIMGRGRAYFIEVKLYKDKLSPEQLEFRNCIVDSNSKNVFHLIATENDYVDIRDAILQNKIYDNLF